MTTRHLVDPELLSSVDQLAPMTFSYETVPKIREAMDGMAASYVAPTNDGVSFQTKEIPGKSGDPDVPVLIYKPEAQSGSLPAVLFIHGGGYFCGRPIHTDAWSRRLVRELGAVVFVVDYRLSPETRYPGSIEDCYAALLWIHREAKTLGIDPKRIAIEGVSAGGGLAAALALLARDRKETPIAFQSLIYPMLDDRTGRATGEPRTPNAGEFVWPYEGNAFGWEALLDKAVGGPNVSPYAAAARATDLTNLPPAFVGVGVLDALIGENVDYAMKLIEAGVPTELHLFPGAFHGFDAFDGGASSVGNDFRSMRVDVLRKAFAKK